MIIQCQACKTKFRVGDDKVKPPGIMVRCSKCGEVFFFEYSLSESPFQEAGYIPSEETESTTPETAEESFPEEDEQSQTTEPEFTDEQPAVVSFDEPETPAEEEKPFPENPEIHVEDMGQEEPVDEAEKIEEGNEGSNEEYAGSFSNLEIDPLDNPDNIEDEPVTDKESIAEAPEAPSVKDNGSEFKAPSGLDLDQEVLEQTYTKGTVAASAELSKSLGSEPTTVRKYPRRISREGGFATKIFGWVFGVVLLGALFLLSMFILNVMNIYTNDYFSRFSTFTKSLYSVSGGDNIRKTIKISNDKGSWKSSKYGQVYVVSGEIVNRSGAAVNYVKLRVNYISDDTSVFIQELYAGNTLSSREIKNSSLNSIQSKLNRKNGDVSYDDANNLDGLNFDIQPGESIPFFSVYPAKDKILGLKYKIEVVGYESAIVGENT